MKSNDIRLWAVTTEGIDVESGPQRVALLQAQAVFELAAQVAELREFMQETVKKLTSNGCVDVCRRG